MKKTRIAVLLLFLVSTAGHANVSKELKRALFDRYDQKNMVVIYPRMLVSTLEGSGGNILDYTINYDFFHPTWAHSTWPKKYKRRNLLNEHVTEEVESAAGFTDPMVPGEMIRVRLFYVAAGKEGQHQVDFYLEALDGKRVARYQNIYSDGGSGLIHKIPFGFHFRFLFPPKAESAPDAAYYDLITKEIGTYFVPADEHQQMLEETAAATESRKNISIEPGMSKEDVLRMLGEPLRIITFGSKTTLKYQDITVELENDKVIDVKVN